MANCTAPMRIIINTESRVLIMKKTTKLLCLVLALITVLSLTACGKSWVCDWCEKKFSGTAYYDGSNLNSTLCKECAVSYFAPFSIEGYKK